MTPRPARIAVTGRHVLYVYFASKQAISASAMATLRSAKVCALASSVCCFAVLTWRAAGFHLCTPEICQNRAASAVDPPTDNSGDVGPLVQAMAGFGGS